MQSIATTLRLVYQKLAGRHHSAAFTDRYVELTGQAASDLIYSLLCSPAPCMVSRFGSIEIKITAANKFSRTRFLKYPLYISGRIDSFHFTPYMLLAASRNAGIFPATPEVLSRFGERMEDDMRDIDLLGSCQFQEVHFAHQLANARRCSLADLDPFSYSNPWSRALEGKRVLVVHPFKSSIDRQFKKRKQLHVNPNVLPDCDLVTLQSVQSIAHEPTPFGDWHEALRHMENQIDQIEYDIAIIGCGAYGLPLAAHVKRMGKKAVHLGGATQLLFGIKGKRWEDEPVARLMNEHWIHPSAEETPSRFKEVEGGCYW